MKKILFLLYTIIELIIYILLCFDILDNDDIFNYSFIITNFIVSIIILIIRFKLKTFNKKNILISLGLFFTCIADYFLIINGNEKALGVLFFLFTQICYMILVGINKKNMYFYIGLILIMEILAIIITKDYYDIVVGLTMIYISVFFINIIFSIYYKKVNIFFTIGLILFILCDICVGLSCFEMFQNALMIKITGSLIFIFYLPGQYFILFSDYKLKQN